MGEAFSLLFPWSAWDCWWLAPLALFFDLWLGDPALPWRHPVCALGRSLQYLERPARCWMEKGRLSGTQYVFRGRLAGCVALLLLLCVTGLVVRALLALPWLSGILALYLAWSGLAMGCLLQTGDEVLRRVEYRPLDEARLALSWLVSRDTDLMDRPLMRKTLADTLAENFTDAMLAPFFWLLLCGPVGLWLYKAVSTTDSMWGYLTPRWRWLGWAGARADDILAFIPARLSAFLLWLTDVSISRCFPALRVWQGRWPGMRVVARQARAMPSPNSGWSMTASAWLCGARMAGPSIYFGELVEKGWQGPPEDEAVPWDAVRIRSLCTLLQTAAVVGGVVLCVSIWLVFFFVE